MVEEWNTGREYTADGQLIRAKLLDDGIVIFHDTSRCIYGQIDYLYDPEGPWSDIEDFVMHHYDAGRYSWHPLAGSL